LYSGFAIQYGLFIPCFKLVQKYGFSKSKSRSGKKTEADVFLLFSNGIFL
jgi:hypothetical protein